MNDRFFDIGPLGSGRLWIGPRPPQGDSLDAWASDASQIGINHVVSLIEDAEVERHGLGGEGEILKRFDIGFTRFPIDDFDVPDGGAFRKLIDQLTSRLANAETLMLHCAGGVGRAGTTACCLMVEQGMNPDRAMQQVSTARGESVPETPQQADFIRRWKNVQV